MNYIRVYGEYITDGKKVQVKSSARLRAAARSVDAMLYLPAAGRGRIDARGFSGGLPCRPAS